MVFSNFEPTALKFFLSGFLACSEIDLKIVMFVLWLVWNN